MATKTAKKYEQKHTKTGHVHHLKKENACENVDPFAGE